MLEGLVWGNIFSNLKWRQRMRGVELGVEEEKWKVMNLGEQTGRRDGGVAPFRDSVKECRAERLLSLKLLTLDSVFSILEIPRSRLAEPQASTPPLHPLPGRRGSTLASCKQGKSWIYDLMIPEGPQNHLHRNKWAYKSISLPLGKFPIPRSMNYGSIMDRNSYITNWKPLSLTMSINS